jgi:hypothetical protein
MADFKGGITEPIERSSRRTTPKSWPHDNLCLAVYGTPSLRSWGTHCWCKCVKCWDPAKRICVCSLCPCPVQREDHVRALQLVPLGGRAEPRPVRPRQRASQTHGNPKAQPKARAKPRRT